MGNLTSQRPSLKFHCLLRFHHWIQEPWILDLGDRFESLVGQAYEKALFSKLVP